MTRKQIILAASVILAFALTHQIIFSLSFLENTLTPEYYLTRTTVALGGFLTAILLAWSGFRFVGGVLFALFASIMVFFVCSVSASSFAVWLTIAYATICFMLFRLDEFYENQIAVLLVDREKYQNERNDLELSYKNKGEGISIFFEKYSTYYNLRKLAEELASTLSVAELSRMIVERTAEFIPRGDHVLATYSDPDGTKLSVMGTARISKTARPAGREGDLFDLWAVRNRKRLIVNDAQQDFRFDLTQTAKLQGVRSLIIAPLLHDRRVIGTLRLNSERAETFTNDDLRLLDAIASLSSSALSSALLYEQTEELAIRDSLTGLYVRRYFFDRLKQEHQRAMLTKRPLSLLLCDLDNFKLCNDRFGHAAGDLMLVNFARILKETCESATVARYGGEEFAILLPETPLAAAVECAEKIRRTVEERPFSIRRAQIAMTVSVGAASIPDHTLDAEALLQKSDEALYKAKRAGRNRVCVGEA